MVVRGGAMHGFDLEYRCVENCEVCPCCNNDCEEGRECNLGFEQGDYITKKQKDFRGSEKCMLTHVKFYEDGYYTESGRIEELAILESELPPVHGPMTLWEHGISQSMTWAAEEVVGAFQKPSFWGGKELPKSRGEKIKFRRYLNLTDLNLEPLIEGSKDWPDGEEEE